MKLSVVVPTLNDRELLASTLDALSAHAPDAEVIVVNGPSADGTTGMVRNREDIDVLVQISERNVSVARNAGLDIASGDAVAMLGQKYCIQSSWEGAIREELADGADAVTGPVNRTLSTGTTTRTLTARSIAGTEVSLFDGGNVAVTKETLDALDGFDEYLEEGGEHDFAHRLARTGRTVDWHDGMSVQTEYREEELADENWGWKYRSLAYCLAKNYGLRPTAVGHTIQRALSDAGTTASGLLSGATTPTRWLGNGRAVVSNIAIGAKDGLVARLRDRTPRRNPNGISSRDDRAVERYDWR